MSDRDNQNESFLQKLKKAGYWIIVIFIPVFSFFTIYEWVLAADARIEPSPLIEQIKIYFLILAMLDSCLLATFLGTNAKLARQIERPNLAQLWTTGCFIFIVLPGFAASCAIVYKIGFEIGILRNMALATASFLVATLPLVSAFALYQKHIWDKDISKIEEANKQIEANRKEAVKQSPELAQY